MRIIGGNFKGKKIFLPKDKNTRPLRDLVKESIFNLIEHSNKLNLKIAGSYVLDLFSGSGSFGLECISRGSLNVIFIENYQKILSILKKNIQHLRAEEKSKIIEEDCFKFFNKDSLFKEKFQIIFIDPPFKEKNVNLIIEKIKKESLLTTDGIIILHRHKNDTVEITNKLNVLDTRKYGISKITIGR